ncbi:angiotensin-converting enzyme-like isoform X1 [Crassostrea virginica]
MSGCNSGVILANLIFGVLVLIQGVTTDSIKIQNEETALEFVVDHDETYKVLWNMFYKSAWEYSTNATVDNEIRMNKLSSRLSNFDREAARFAKMFDFKKFSNSTLKRQFIKIIERSGLYAEDQPELLEKITMIQSDLSNAYREAYYCLPRENCLHKNGLEKIMKNSRDNDELLAVWEGWRHATVNLKAQFTTLVVYLNEAVQNSGYTNIADWWGGVYEMPYFRNDITRLFQELGPLYQEIHAYTRRRLMSLYGSNLFPLSGHIPAHLLGSLEGGSSDELYNLIEPFPNASRVNITKIMVEQNVNISLMYRLAEDFYVSLGMEPMTQEFWEKSMFVRPSTQPVECGPSTWDFGDGKDYRIKACTQIDEKNLIMAHQEVGHIVYYQSYKLQDAVFRSGANPAFQDAFAKLVTLSMNTPEHHQKVGFISAISKETEGDINYLLRLALDKVAVLPYVYSVEHWRWKVFRGMVSPSDFNKEWWKNRCLFEGITPPVSRSDQDFDSGAHYHVTSNMPLIKQFLSTILQFQWQESLCKVAGHQGDVHRCNLYGSKAVGDVLKKALSLGSSQPWSKVMKILTGQTRISVEPLLRFFDPLLLWLKEQNKEENIGWARSCPSIIPHAHPSATLDNPNKYLRFFYVVPSL